MQLLSQFFFELLIISKDRAMLKVFTCASVLHLCCACYLCAVSMQHAFATRVFVSCVSYMWLMFVPCVRRLCYVCYVCVAAFELRALSPRFALPLMPKSNVATAELSTLLPSFAFSFVPVAQIM